MSSCFKQRTVCSNNFIDNYLSLVINVNFYELINVVDDKHSLIITKIHLQASTHTHNCIYIEVYRTIERENKSRKDNLHANILHDRQILHADIKTLFVRVYVLQMIILAH